MRRSAAPSQLHGNKRPKFMVPVKRGFQPSLSQCLPHVHTPTEQKFEDEDAKTSLCEENMHLKHKELSQVNEVPDTTQLENASVIVDCKKKPVQRTFLSPLAVNKNTTASGTKPDEQDGATVVEVQEDKNHPTSDGAVNPVPEQSLQNNAPVIRCPKKPSQRAAFTSPLIEQNRTAAASQALQGSAPTSQCYYSVVWCKLSKKKHKKWEGDAVLITHGKSVTLMDMEGKEIGKGSGYKALELASMQEDHTLCIGGKEIQVMSVLTEEQFKTGKCFTAAGSASQPAGGLGLSSFSSKPFQDPFRSPSTTASSTAKPAAVTVTPTPRFDPTAPGALVMPRPSLALQRRHAKGGVVVDVVVDPYLSQHLRPHQRGGVTFLYSSVMGLNDFNGYGAILADDMGLGKTLQCITLIWMLLKQGPYGGRPVIRKALIITPGSLVKNWYQEFKKWLGTERINVYAVNAEKKVDEFVKTTIYPVLVISYEMFLRNAELLSQQNFDIVICDEGHRLKNTSIKTTSLIMSLPTRRRVVLTGTPIQNDLQEFFSIVDFCNPGILGTSAAFRRVYEEPILASRQPEASEELVTLGEERAAELTRLTKMFVLRRTQEVNNQYLPPKGELVLFCRPSELQLVLYRRLIHSPLISRCLTGGSAGDGSCHLACIGALKNLCNHPRLVHGKALAAAPQTQESIYSGLASDFSEDYGQGSVQVADSGKLTVLQGILRNIHSLVPREKVVLVSNHTKTLDLLQQFCEGSGYRCLRLDGHTPTAVRQDIVNKFNSKHSMETVFLLSSKAGGVGLNLIGASRLILYDIDWNPANDLQAMARVWRDGQSRKVHIYRLLITGTLEEKVYQRQVSKQGLSSAVMDMRLKKDVQFSLEDLRDLFSLNEHTACDTHELLECSCTGEVLEHSEGEAVPASLSSPGSTGLGPSPSRPSQKNLSMNELLDWKHLHGGQDLYRPEWCLDSVDNISFIFWNETKDG